ncbi:hypothetical protein ACIPV3_20195 [Streptomyces albidoflavus]
MARPTEASRADRVFVRQKQPTRKAYAAQDQPTEKVRLRAAKTGWSDLAANGPSRPSRTPVPRVAAVGRA